MGEVMKVALAALCLVAQSVSAQLVLSEESAETAASAMGLGIGFRQEALAEFKAMGFSIDTRVALMGPRDAKLPEWVLREAGAAPKAAVFSMAQGHGASAVCWVGLRPERAGMAPEHILALAATSFGAEKKAVWRMMFRHELGHCALAMMAQKNGAPDVFMAEPFADVFGLDWAKRVEPQGEQLARAYAMARRRVSGGAHGTWSELERWRMMAPAPTPCMAAWTVSPMDARTASVACPKTR
jgi:hypothetical protein